MKSFIKKLVKEKKIKQDIPSEDVSFAYVKKSGKSLISAKTLLNIENYEDAVALTYYSMYYSALGLLFRCGIKSENHAGTIILIKLIFDIDNSMLKDAKKERVDKQYYVDFKATKEDVKKGISVAEEFNAIIKDKLDRIKENEIIDYRERFMEL